jgi:methionyl-tRNA synthetase
MSQNPNKFYVTTPIYYVNARPHIGHAYTTIVADVLARRHRLLGEDTFFLTGTDEHGQKIERSAAAAGIPPQEFTDEVSAKFKALWDRMGLTYNDYIRTTEARHKQGAQKLFRELYERGHIYLSTYTGSYCVSDEAFVDAPAGTPCPDCGRILETVTEENFFFRLSNFQRPLIDLIESDTLLITPDSSKNEVLSFLRGNTQTATEGEPSLAQSAAGNEYVPGALKDLSVSRSSFTWGIPVPEPAASEAAQKHVIYVWLDALANYMTAIGYGSDDVAKQAEFAKFWPADLHLVGKEITRFHCVYWPAFLLAAEIPTPKQITANGWLLFDNAKMSKSRGNVVRTETILEAFGEQVYAKQFPESTKRERDLFASDVLRYFLLREIPFGQDGSFSFDAMVTRYNADLANGYGNLVSRVLNMIQQYFDAAIPPEPTRTVPYSLGELGDNDPRLSRDRIQGRSIEASIALRGTDKTLNFAGGLAFVWSVIAEVDAAISAEAPWKLAKSEATDARTRLEKILYDSVEAIRFFTAMLYPVLPASATKVWAQLGLGDIEEAARNGELKNLQWGDLKPSTKLGPLGPIFPRADKSLAQVMIDMENENARPEAPLKDAATPSPAAAVSTDSSHPAAPPRALDEPSSTLPVGGSSAVTTERADTPSHHEAQASGVFATAAAKVPETPSQITIDDFAKVELRVAQILVAERIPKADKLLRLEVDLGYEKRQILSGIAEWYTPEDLVGRRIVVITNLAPRKMRGLESHGMLLAASEGEGGKPVLATFGEEIALGSRLK